MNTEARRWPTRTASVMAPEEPQRTEVSPDVYADRAGALRAEMRLLDADVADVHGELLRDQLRDRTSKHAKRSPTELLNHLACLGIAWSDVARIVGVSVPAVRKWRQGDGISGPNRQSLARLVAVCELLESKHLVDQVSSWLDVPIGESFLTGIDVLSQGGFEDLLAFAGEHVQPSLLVERYGSPPHPTDDLIDVFVNTDGNRSIRVRPRD